MSLSAAELLLHIKGVLYSTEQADDSIVFLRHAERGKLKGDKASRDAEPITAAGAAAAVQLGHSLRLACPPATPARFLYMGSDRVQQTAHSLAQGWDSVGQEGSDPRSLVLGLAEAAGVAPEQQPLGQLRLGQAYEEYKQQVGWEALIEGWLGGTLPAGIMVPPETVCLQVMQAVAKLPAPAPAPVPTPSCSASTGIPAGITLIATHDVFIFGMLKGLRGLHVTHVDFMGGFILPRAELQAYLSTSFHNAS